jgi:hypothetical protein
MLQPETLKLDSILRQIEIFIENQGLTDHPVIENLAENQAQEYAGIQIKEAIATLSRIKKYHTAHTQHLSALQEKNSNLF